MKRFIISTVFLLASFDGAYCLNENENENINAIAIGNGGDVVACSNGKNELLDVFEAREMRSIPLLIGDNKLTVDERMDLLFARIQRLDPNRANQYRAWYRDFINETLFKAGTVLVDVPDSDHLALPGGCEIKQVAIQREPSFPEDKRYVVDRDLWNTLDNSNRAALILHEFIYRDAVKERHEDSQNTRYFNSYIFSGKIADFTMKEYLSYMRKLNFTVTTTVQGFTFFANSIQYYEHGAVKSANLVGKQTAILQGKSIVLSDGYFSASQTNYISFAADKSLLRVAVYGRGEALKQRGTGKFITLSGLGCLTLDHEEVVSWDTSISGCRDMTQDRP